MTDTRLRQLERRWKETGSVRDEADYLLERVRVGDLDRNRLDLAAYLGHEASRLARRSFPGRWALLLSAARASEVSLRAHQPSLSERP